MSNGGAGVARVMPGDGFVRRTARALTLALISALAIVLAGCGGGVEVGGDGFSVGVTIEGRPYGGGAIASGAKQDVSLWAGESVALEASEPVRWTVYAGNAAVPADGSTVYYGGASIRATMVSSARILIDTGASGPLAQPVPFTLVATSTWDAALVATITVWVY